MVVSKSGGVKVFDPFLQAQAFGVRENVCATTSLLHREWDVWSISDGFRPGSLFVTMATRDGKIVAEEVKKEVPKLSSSSLSSNPNVSGMLKPLIASSKALSCQEKVYECFTSVLWSRLSVAAEVLEVLRIFRESPGAISAEAVLASGRVCSVGSAIFIECKIVNKSIVKLSRGVWDFCVSVNSSSFLSTRSGSCCVKRIVVPVSEDIESDGIWTPPEGPIALEGVSAVGPPFTVEMFLALAKDKCVKCYCGSHCDECNGDNETQQRLAVAAKRSVSVGLTAPPLVWNGFTKVVLPLSKEKVFGALDTLSVACHPEHVPISAAVSSSSSSSSSSSTTTAAPPLSLSLSLPLSLASSGRSEGFDVMCIGFERRFGAALLHMLLETIQKRAGSSSGNGNGNGSKSLYSSSMALALPGAKGEPIARMFVSQENTVSVLRVRGRRGDLLAVHAALLLEVARCLGETEIGPDPHQAEWRSALLQASREMRAGAEEVLCEFEALEALGVENAVDGPLLERCVQRVREVAAGVVRLHGKWVSAGLSGELSVLS